MHSLPWSSIYIRALIRLRKHPCRRALVHTLYLHHYTTHTHSGRFDHFRKNVSSIFKETETNLTQSMRLGGHQHGLGMNTNSIAAAPLNLEAGSSPSALPLPAHGAMGGSENIQFSRPSGAANGMSIAMNTEASLPSFSYEGSGMYGSASTHGMNTMNTMKSIDMGRMGEPSTVGAALPSSFTRPLAVPSTGLFYRVY